jgi:hypothetical protein
MFGERKSATRSSGSTRLTLHDRIRTGLVEGFKDSLSADSQGLSDADILIQQGGRVAVVEVKTGDPDLPLPSSTSAQMLLLKRQARQKFSEADVQEVLPVLVTNYTVSADDEKELEDQGIKVIRIDSTASGSDDFEKFSRRVASLTGLQTDLV